MDYLAFILWSLLWLGGWLIVYEAVRRSPLIALLIFVGGSLFKLPQFLFRYDWPYVLKVSCVLIGAIWLIVLRTTRLGRYRPAFYLIYAMALLNVVMLSVGQFFLYNQSYADWLNGLAGIFVALTLPGISAMRVNTREKYRDFEYDLSYPWIIGYSVWAYAFFCLDLSADDCRHHIAIFLAPLVVSLFHRKRYAQARAYILGTQYILYFYLPQMYAPLDRMPINKLYIGNILSVVSLVWMVGYTFYCFFCKRKTPRSQV